nr:immunoglobulin heavy chain junction region [Mus musculus]
CARGLYYGSRDWYFDVW